MLDHVTLHTNDLEGTHAFFETVLDLKLGYRPDFPFPGYLALRRRRAGRTSHFR